MRNIRSTALALGFGGVLALALGVSPANAAPPFKWNAPDQVTSGVPVAVSSKTPCPPAPTPGDSVLVQITLQFPGGGAGGEVVAANPDGSWAGSVTFVFSGVSGGTTIAAECLDFTGSSGTPYVQYQSRHTKLVP
jgi:hypothetical protein